jgi:hypothetical protein
MSGSDSYATATVKADALTGAALGLGWTTSLIATTMMAPMVIVDFGWLLCGMRRKRGERDSTGQTAGLTVDQAAGFGGARRGPAHGRTER